ncbi:TetR/AcrR family transcriptional regulator [Streptomyces sp. NPDC004542]|uniref:TetR/AcrR family transcriptional regulator n=1 Tax=Streptomyces sp. NPDC004542 TaxID=3154281 RepID=UPI0033BEF8EE
MAEHNGVRGLGRTTRSEERKAEIIRAAMEVIAENGYRGTSLAVVAERVGLTQAGLLHHFPTKEALLVAVLEARDQWDIATATFSGTFWPLDMLGDLVEYNSGRPGIVQVFTVLAGESVTEDHPARPYFHERYRLLRELTAQSLHEEFGDRLPGGLTPQQAAPLVAAVMDGLQVQWLHDPEEVDMAGSFRAFVGLLKGTAGQDADHGPGASG